MFDTEKPANYGPADMQRQWDSPMPRQSANAIPAPGCGHIRVVEVTKSAHESTRQLKAEGFMFVLPDHAKPE
jgi:hypothetical protein